MREAQGKKTVVVLGAARSGTSVTAGILKALGVDIASTGDSTRANPKGSFEDKGFQRLDNEIFRAVGQEKSYWDPPTRGEIMAQRVHVAPRIQSLVSEKSRDKSIWGWKNPKAILTVELFLPYLFNPYLVTVFRNPLHTAESSVAHKRGKITFLDALKLVNFYTGEMLAFLERHPDLPNIFLSFEEIVANPRKEAERLADFLGLELTEKKMEDIYSLVIPRDQIETAKKKATGGFARRLPRFIRKRLAGR